MAGAVPGWAWALLALLAGMLVVGGVVAVVVLGDDPPATFPVAASRPAINLVSAKDVSCSPDRTPLFGTGADLEVRIRLDGRTVLQASQRDEEEPIFARAVGVRPGKDSVVGVQVWEHEPGDTRLGCDVGAGPGKEFRFGWDGSAREVGLRGTAEGAVEVALALGPAPFGAPAGLAVTPAATRVELAWTPLVPAPEAFHVARGDGGGVAATVAGTAHAASIPNLCDGIPYEARVVAHSGAWWIGTDVTFTTPNVPPVAPRVLSARATELPDGLLSLRVAWESPSPHDAERYEVFAGPTGSPLGQGAPRWSSDVWPTRQEWDASMRASDADEVVVVRVVDEGGLSAESAAFRIGAPDQDPTPGLAEASCRAADPLDPGKDNDVPFPAAGALAALAAAGGVARRRTR